MLFKILNAVSISYKSLYKLTLTTRQPFRSPICSEDFRLKSKKIKYKTALIMIKKPKPDPKHDYIALESSPVSVSNANSKQPLILRPREEQIENDFFILDQQPSEIKIDLAYLSNKKFISPSSNYISSSSNSPDIIPVDIGTNLVGASFSRRELVKSFVDSPSKSNSLDTVPSDDICIIYERLQTSDFISLNDRCKNAIPVYNLSPKRNYHNSGSSDNDIEILQKKSDKKTNPSTLKNLDDSIIVISESHSKVKSYRCQGSFATKHAKLTKESSQLEEEAGQSSIEEASHSHLKEEAAHSSIEEEDINDKLKASDLVIENTNDNYMPLRNINISDIIYDVHISTDVLEKRAKLEQLRKWEWTRLGEAFVMGARNNQSGCSFTVLNYNVLSQKLLTDNLFLYNNCDIKHLDWVYRWTLLQYEIKYFQPDIMTFQEVEASYYHTHFLPWFTHCGFTCTFKKRTGDKVDGCLIAFKSEKFSLIEENSVEYNQPKGGPILDRDNIGLIVKLTPKTFYMPFCVATTHFLYNPKRQDIKLAQLVLLLTELDRICYKTFESGRISYHPLILNGDFNTDQYSKIIQMIKYGNVKYEGMCRKTLCSANSFSFPLGTELIPSKLGISDYCQHTVLEERRQLEKVRGDIFSLSDKRKLEESIIKLAHSSRCKENPVSPANTSLTPSFMTGEVKHQFLFRSVYNHKLARLRGASEVTTYHDRWLTVDYMFYTKVNDARYYKKMVEGPLKLLGKCGLLSASEATAGGNLPNAVCPSDHFPLVAKFFLKQS